MSDIVERLRGKNDWPVKGIWHVYKGEQDKLRHEAADEIVRLRAEVAHLTDPRRIVAGGFVRLSDFDAMEAERDRLRDALTPSAETKAAYMGEFSIQVTDAYEDDDGEFAEYIRRVLIPWDAIKEIMAAIRARAALKGDTPSWENLRGVAPDATGDLSSEAFIRQQRDEWDSPPALKGDTP